MGQEVRLFRALIGIVGHGGFGFFDSRFEVVVDLPFRFDQFVAGLAQEKVRARCIQALKEDGCGAIVLGCGGMATLAQALTRELRVPVIDGVSAAVKMVESLVALGLSTSKQGDLAFPEAKSLSGKFQVFNPF